MIARDIPAEQIRFIHEATTDAQEKRVVRQGQKGGRPGGGGPPPQRGGGGVRMCRTGS